MNKLALRSLLRFGGIAALVLLSAGAAAAETVQYLIQVNTSSVSGTTGFLDFQFNPGIGSSQIALAEITNFNGGGGTLGFVGNSTTGDVAGTLPATVTLVNDAAFNDYFQQFTFGPFFSFVLSLTGPALDRPNGTATSGSTFGVGLFDNSDPNPNSILTSDGVNGFVGEVLVNLNGSTTSHSFPTATNGPSVVSFQAIPEPGTMVLLGFGSLSLLLLGRKAGLTDVPARRQSGLSRRQN